MPGVCEYNLLTIEQCFEYLANRLSKESVNKWVCRLDCPTYVKSDLIDSVIKHDLAKFQSTIRDYNVDYTPISNACSQVFGLSILNDNLANAIFKNEEETSVTEESPFNEEELSALYHQKLDAIKDGALSQGCTNEEVSNIVENLRGLYDEIIRNCLNDRPIEAMLLETVFDSYYLFSGFKALSTNMLKEEKIVIDKFITERMNQNHFISYFLNSCFEGYIFEDDLNIILDDSEQNITNFIEHSALECAVNQPLLSYESATPETSATIMQKPLEMGQEISVSHQPIKTIEPDYCEFKTYILAEDQDALINKLLDLFAKVDHIRKDKKNGRAAHSLRIIIAAQNAGRLKTQIPFSAIKSAFPGRINEKYYNNNRDKLGAENWDFEFRD